eukprot:5458040-Prymnesium_polylepis.2
MRQGRRVASGRAAAVARAVRGGAPAREPSGRLPFARLGDGRRVGRRVHRARRRRRGQCEPDIHDDAA